MIARRISLFTGVYLFLFVLVHLINHGLGLLSVQVMDEARSWMLAPWHNPVGGVLLLASFVVHFLLGMRALYRRNTLKLSYFDWFQLLLGLSIPLLLLPHMVDAIMRSQLTGQRVSYQMVLSYMWIHDPWVGLRQVLGLLAVWLHGCMGLFVWLRLQSWWPGASIFVYPTVVLLPTLALLGFVEAGKEVIASHETSTAQVAMAKPDANQSGARSTSASDSAPAGNTRTDGARDGATDADISGYRASVTDTATGDAASTDSQSADDTRSAATGPASDESHNSAVNQRIDQTIRTATVGYLLVLGLTLLARQLRLMGRAGKAQLQFAGYPPIESPAGVTILEISRINAIDHASLCGGKGRCGTCQVRITRGAGNLEPAAALEREKLRQIGDTDDIRLACQARVRSGEIELEQLLPGYVQARDMPSRKTAGESLADGESA